MTLPYTYYWVKVGSPADKVIRTKIESSERMFKIAEAVGKKWLGDKGVPFKLVTMNSDNFTGFCPDKWRDAMEKLGNAYNQLWIKKEDSSCSWLTPRKRPSYPVQAELIADVATIPDVIAWRSVSVQLFGFSDFVFGMRMTTMTASVTKDHCIVGVPWLATQGAAQNFGPLATFKPMKGLAKLPFEKAMVILYGKEAEERRAKIDEQRKQVAK